MSPKEKAKELVDNYFSWYGDEYYFPYKFAKECALIAVDEILEIKSVDRDYELSNYWQQVKQEIELL